MASGSPIPFIQPDDDGQFHIDKRAAKILSSIKGPVSVVCVAGPYRTGKSYLLNRLIYNENAPPQETSPTAAPVGFQVGSSINACTKGIWLWSEPYFNPATNTTYLFLDTEGLNSTGEEATFDTQIFSLSVLLSSVFILNTQTAITESELEQLELVAECSKKISFEGGDVSDDESDSVDQQLALHFPRLIWVLRDFALELVDKDGNKISSNQYLERTLAPLPPGKKLVEEKNRIRKCIRDCFLKRECVPLPRPVNDEAHLRRLQNVPVNELRKEFQDGIRSLKMRSLMLYGHFTNPLPAQKHHQNNDTRKYISNKPVTGDVLAGMAKMYVDAINSGQVPTILSAWQSVLETKKLAVSQEYATAIETFLWSLVSPQKATKHGSSGGGGGKGTQPSQVPEPELDTNIITEKYHQKITALNKSLQSHFPGDADSINLVVQTVAAKTEPVLQKVCQVADMHAVEHNKKLFKALMVQINPHYKVSNEGVFGKLAAWDPATGMKPQNNSQSTLDHIAFVLDAFQKNAKGADRGAGVERELLLELASRANTAQYSTISDIAEDYLDLAKHAETLESSLEQGKKDTAEARAQADRLNAQAMELNQKLHDLREEKSNIVSKLREEKMNLQSQLASEKSALQTQLDLLSNKLALSTESLQAASHDKKQLRHELNDVKQQLNNAQSTHATASNKLAQVDAEYKNLTTRLAEVNAQAVQREAELKAVTKAAQSASDKAKDQEQNIRSLEQMISSLQATQKAIKAENSHLSDEVMALKTRLVQADQQLSALGDADSMAQSLRTQLQAAQRECDHSRRDLQLKEQQNSHLTTKVNQLEAEVAELHQLRHQLEQTASLETSKRKSMEFAISQQAKKQRYSTHSDDSMDHFSDPIDYSNFNNDDQNGPMEPNTLVKLTTSKRTKTPVKKSQRRRDDDDDDDDDDDEMDYVARKEASRRSTISHMVNDHDDEDDDSDDGHANSGVRRGSRGTPQKAQAGWSNPMDFSPAKLPDQAKIMERRRRDGSIFAQDEADDDDDEEVTPPPKRGAVGKAKSTAPKPIFKHGGPSSSFKAAAKASYSHDNEAEYTRLKSQLNKKGNRAPVSESEDESAFELPPDAPPLPADINSRTVAQLKSWLTAFDVAIPPKATKAQLIVLVRANDPRL